MYRHMAGYHGRTWSHGFKTVSNKPVYGKNGIVGTGQKLNNQNWGMKSKIILDYRSMVFGINPDWVGVQHVPRLKPVELKAIYQSEMVMTRQQGMVGT